MYRRKKNRTGDSSGHQVLTDLTKLLQNIPFLLSERYLSSIAVVILLLFSLKFAPDKESGHP